MVILQWKFPNNILCVTNLSLYKTWRHTEGVNVEFHSLLITGLDGVSGQLHSPAALVPERFAPLTI
jgi:hypothetical protein